MTTFPFVPPTNLSISCRKLIRGVGINDSNYQTQPIVDGVTYLCPTYRTWKAMFERCYCPKWHLKQPTYIDCTVDERWHSFMAFREWHISQPDYLNLCLDKDILFPGNKVYGPDTCVMVSHAVNNFYTNVKSGDHKYPIGVTCVNGKYIAEVSIGTGKRWRSIRYSTIEQASLAYYAKRREIGLSLASVQSDKRVADAIIASLK